MAPRSIGDQVRQALHTVGESRRYAKGARTEVEAIDALASRLSDEGATLLRRLLR